jgi:hypothetical protein
VKEEDNTEASALSSIASLIGSNVVILKLQKNRFQIKTSWVSRQVLKALVRRRLRVFTCMQGASTTHDASAQLRRPAELFRINVPCNLN